MLEILDEEVEYPVEYSFDAEDINLFDTIDLTKEINNMNGDVDE